MCAPGERLRRGVTLHLEDLVAVGREHLRTEDALLPEYPSPVSYVGHRPSARAVPNWSASDTRPQFEMSRWPFVNRARSGAGRPPASIRVPDHTETVVEYPIAPRFELKLQRRPRECARSWRARHSSAAA